MALWTLKDLNILVVDDFPEMRSMMRGMLLPYGANKLTEVRNGDEAIDAMAKQTMDIVLCDYSLGNGKDGQQVLEEVKARDLLPYSSIFLLVTAENTADMVMGAVEYQPDDYLVKPFTKTVLQTRLKKLQERKEGLKDITRALEQKNFPHVIDLCDRMIAAGANNSSELLKLKGELLIRVNHYDAALALYQEALQARDFSWAHFGLGQAYFYLQQFDAARTAFETLLQRNNNYVVAYDWLAKIQRALGDTKKSQDLLSDAIKISPKSILRQKALAEAAFENNDFDTAEAAYKNVVREGKNSVHRSPSDFGGLAKVYIKKSAPQEAAKIVNSMSTAFQKGNSATQLQSAVIQTLMFKEMDNAAGSEKALEQVMALYATNPVNLPTSAAMEIAEACLGMGKNDYGNELLKHVIRNNHEDETILDKVKDVCAKSGQTALADLVETTRQEVIATNNKGVELVKQGKLEESIELFVQAARAMPENVTVNLNAALSLIAFMQKSGVNDKMVQLAEGYLGRVTQVSASNERYQKVAQQFRNLVEQQAKKKSARAP